MFGAGLEGGMGQGGGGGGREIEEGGRGSSVAIWIITYD